MSIPNAACCICADILDDGHYQVTIVKTGLDTASLNICEWDLGVDYTKAAKENNSYGVFDVRVTANVLTCQTAAPLQNPVITLTLSPAGMITSLMLDVSHTWWNNFNKVMPLTPADYAAAEKFLTDAAFPVG